MYNNYVWNKDGTVKGQFELMYQEVEDPWLHSQEEYGKLSTSLYLINFLKFYNFKALHSIGCGKGHYEKWISNQLNQDFIISGVDLSKTAIEFAKKIIPQGSFFSSNAILDIKNTNQEGIDLSKKLYLIRELLWYVGHDWIKIINQIPLKSIVAIELTFYSNQKYQNKVFNGAKDFISKMQKYLKIIKEVRSKVNKDGNFILLLIAEKYA